MNIAYRHARTMGSLIALVSAAFATPAFAEMPASVRTMLDIAIASGSEGDIAAVAKIAKAANPADAAEIDALITAHKTQLAAVEEAKKREAGFFENWHGNGELGGFISTGNTSNRGLSAGLTLNKEGMRWRHKLRVLADYQRAEGVTTRDQQMATYEGNYKFSDKLYLFGLGMYERDEFQGFASRTTLSGGAGYSVVATDNVMLDIKAGPAWRRTDWLGIPNTSEFSGLGGADFTWQISPTLKLTDNAQALWGADNSTYSNIAAFTANLSGALSGRLSYSVRHETNPPPGNKSTDTITRATLVYGF